MSKILSASKNKAWFLQLTILCIILGMLLALALKTQRQAISEGSPPRWSALRDEFVAVKRENVTLKQDVADYKARYEKLAKDQAVGISSTKGLQQSLDEARLLAGTTKVAGSGVVVTLRDSPKLDQSETRIDIVEEYMVHDSDIRDIVNELFSAGAEAVSVNDQRFVATTSVRCAGAIILVNSVHLAPPYVIKAIGDPKVLEEALKLPMGVADGLFLLDMIKIEQKNEVVIPAYEGSTRFNFAKKR